VPTPVVKDPDGAYYVGQLTGFPFPPGGAGVFRVRPGDRHQRAGQHPEGELSVGRLVRVNKDASRTTLASEGLAAPGGFVLGHGAAYITNNSILSDAGQVVKVAI
jgi:hypothetical protein